MCNQKNSRAAKDSESFGCLPFFNWILDYSLGICDKKKCSLYRHNVVQVLCATQITKDLTQRSQYVFFYTG